LKPVPVRRIRSTTSRRRRRPCVDCRGASGAHCASPRGIYVAGRFNTSFQGIGTHLPRVPPIRTWRSFDIIIVVFLYLGVPTYQLRICTQLYSKFFFALVLTYIHGIHIYVQRKQGKTYLLHSTTHTRHQQPSYWSLRNVQL